MNQFNLGNFTNRFINNYPTPNPGGSGLNASNANEASNGQFPLTNQALNENLIQKNLMQQSGVLNTFNAAMLNDLRMNSLASLERSLYIKDLMKLPKEMQEVLVILQNNNVTSQEAAKLLSSTNINLSILADIIQKSGKEAMNKLVLVMANASKQGINDTSQIRDAIKFINASVSVAAQDNPNQILKTFMLLYLPWLPLQEGIDFDLEIENSENSDGDSETSITIMISTRNYGNVKITLVLVKGGSIEIFITCCTNFPKEELLKRIKNEGKLHSIQTNTTFEQNENKKDTNSPRQTKISTSNLNEVNPFLLLMANAVIRHTIELDNLM